MTDDAELQQALREFNDHLCAARAEMHANMAAFEVARADYLASPNPTFHRYVSAKMDYDYRIVSFTIDDVALAGYDSEELSEIVTDVLRRSAQHMRDALKEQTDTLCESNERRLAEFREGVGALLGKRPSEPPASRVPEPRVFEETSSDGQIRLGLRFAGDFAFCRIAPSALDAHKAPRLAERIVRLHAAAHVRAVRDMEAFLSGRPPTGKAIGTDQ